MILLKSTTETLELTTSSTADIDFSVSFADITTTTFNPSTVEGKVVTSTTTTIVAAPAAATQRQIKLITITNRHASTSNTILVKKDISGTEYYLTPTTVTLLAGETLQYLDTQGWVVYATNGSIKGDLSAGGSNTTVQLNNNGTLTGDIDFTFNSSTKELDLGGTNTSMLIQSITTEPAVAPAGVLRIYSKNVSGRIVPKWVGPAGLDSVFQPALFGNNIVMWTNTSATAGLWTGTVGAAAGTFANTLPTFTNVYTSVRRARYANVITTTNQILGQRGSEAMYFRGSISSTGGFFFFARFGLDVWTTGGRLFVGMHTSTTVVSADPSASLNILGFGIDAGNTAITFMHNDGSGTATKDTIAGQPTLANNNGYDAYIFCKPNDSVVYYRLVDINTQTEIINSSTNLDLPVSTTGLTPGVLASNAALTPVTSIAIGLNRIYVETDF
ncbi:MAG: hypothetical protein ABIP50_01775 [Candidatus Saccharimonadales bacterium]